MYVLNSVIRRELVKSPDHGLVEQFTYRQPISLSPETPLHLLISFILHSLLLSATSITSFAYKRFYSVISSTRDRIQSDHRQSAVLCSAAITLKTNDVPQFSLKLFSYNCFNKFVMNVWIFNAENGIRHCLPEYLLFVPYTHGGKTD